MVAVFQRGHSGHVLGVAKAPIESWAPMMLFAIVFGLSMDYEVFLLSSIREHEDASGDNARSVSVGLASTARVITAAATVMVVVFGSFLVHPGAEGDRAGPGSGHRGRRDHRAEGAGSRSSHGRVNAGK